MAAKMGAALTRVSSRSVGGVAAPTEHALPWGIDLYLRDGSGKETKFVFPKTQGEIRRLVEKECASAPVLSGMACFRLHTQEGLFIDITEQIASEIGMIVDREDYGRLMKEHEEVSRQGQKKHTITAVYGSPLRTDDSTKYTAGEITANVLGSLAGNSVIREGSLHEGEPVALLLDRTNFYAVGGGQVGDMGTITTATGQFDVEDTQGLGSAILHFGQVTQGKIEVGQPATLRVDGVRLDTMRNHTSTHLMNLALRDILGEHVEQKGSLVDPDKTRFDFTHQHSLTADEITRSNDTSTNESRPTCQSWPSRCRWPRRRSCPAFVLYSARNIPIRCELS